MEFKFAPNLRPVVEWSSGLWSREGLPLLCSVLREQLTLVTPALAALGFLA